MATVSPLAIPGAIDYFFESEQHLDALTNACGCDVVEGSSIVFTLGGDQLVACYEHAPLYYANPEASCDVCGEKAVFHYWREAQRSNRCRAHANVYTTDDAELISALIAYDDESDLFATSWNAETGWDLDAMAQFLRGFALPEQPRTSAPSPASPSTCISTRSVPTNEIFHHSAASMHEIPDGVVHACITSPPYFGHRSYDATEQIGTEATLETYIDELVKVFREVHRVLRDDGTAWIVLGDSYASKYACNRGSGHRLGAGACPPEQRHNRLSGDLKEMDLMMVPYELARALRKDGWLLRDMVVWNKPHPKPEPRKNRRLTSAHELIIRVAKRRDYYFDVDAIEKLRLRNNVWSIDPVRATFGHPAAYPAELVAAALLASAPRDGLVLDPFMGSGTTAAVARAFGRNYVGYDTSERYIAIAKRRVKHHALWATDFPPPFRPFLDADQQPLQLFAG